MLFMIAFAKTYKYWKMFGIGGKFSEWRAKSAVQIGGLKKGTIFLYVTVGAVAVLIASILMGLFAFNHERWSDNKFGIEYGMWSDITANEVEVWIRMGHAFYIKQTFPKFARIDKKGKERDTSFIGISPSREPIHVVFSVRMEIIRIDDSEMPNLSKRNQKVQPMAYIKNTTLPKALRYIMILWAFGMNNYILFHRMGVATAIIFIITGIYWNYRNYKKKKQIKYWKTINALRKQSRIFKKVEKKVEINESLNASYASTPPPSTPIVESDQTQV